MSVLKWTTEAPTQPGFYFIGNESRKGKKIVEVIEKDGSLYIFANGLMIPIIVLMIEAWAGPIEEPED